MIIINANSLKVERKRLYETPRHKYDKFHESSVRSIVNHRGCAFQIGALLLQARLKLPPPPCADPPRR